MCPDGYSHFNGSCYGIQDRVAVDWNDARAACVELTEKFSTFHLSFDLVSVHTSEENIFISNSIHTTELAFIGLRRNANESDFRWSDHSHFSYENWLHGPLRPVNKKSNMP